MDVGADLNDSQRAALLDGISLLEERVGADVFAPVESNGRRIQRGRISVRNGVKQHGYDGWADRNQWTCRVTLERNAYAELALHELLHCLGLDRDDTDNSLMGEYVGRKLTREHVEFVRGLMGLDRSSAPPELPEDAVPEVPEEDVTSDDGNDEMPVEADAGTTWS